MYNEFITSIKNIRFRNFRARLLFVHFTQGNKEILEIKLHRYKTKSLRPICVWSSEMKKKLSMKVST